MVMYFDRDNIFAVFKRVERRGISDFKCFRTIRLVCSVTVVRVTAFLVESGDFNSVKIQIMAASS